MGGTLGRLGVGLSPAAAGQLTQYAWPGNIRELENVIQRAMILSSGDVLIMHPLHPRSIRFSMTEVQSGLRAISGTGPGSYAN